MGYYTQRDIPFYYGLYRTFAIGDRYFCSVLGPTFPNRFYLLAGTSFGHIRNDLTWSADASRRSSRRSTTPASPGRSTSRPRRSALLFAYVQRPRRPTSRPIAEFFADAAAGTLPPVAFVDPDFIGDEPVRTTSTRPRTCSSARRSSPSIVRR